MFFFRMRTAIPLIIPALSHAVSDALAPLVLVSELDPVVIGEYERQLIFNERNLCHLRFGSSNLESKNI